MTPEPKNLREFIGTNNNVFNIPIYQRNYVWKAAQCEQLYKDVVSIITGRTSNHFFGSIIYKPYNIGSSTEYQIIDGQQRLTTFCIMIIAMRNIVLHSKEIMPNRFTEDELLTAEDYARDYLTSRQLKRLKLKAIAKDSSAYQEIFEKIDDNRILPEYQKHNIVLNYKLFTKWINDDLIEDKYKFEDFNNSLGFINFVAIRLDPYDANPQIIFDSMNSTGIGLKDGDNIRNYLLMDFEDPQLQEQLFKEHWQKIEDNSCPSQSTEEKGQMVTEFVWTWLKLKEKTGTIKRSNTYKEFKKYIEKIGVNNQDVLRELAHYSEIYRVIINGSGSDILNRGTKQDYKELDYILYRLNYIKITTHYVFALALLDGCRCGIINIKEVINAFKLLESYLFRRIILGQPTNEYNKFFPKLYDDIMQKLRTSNQSFYSIFETILSTQAKRLIFPSDNDFYKAMLEKKLFVEVRKERVKYLLDRFNNSNNDKEYFNTLIEDGISIEHIMPQTLSDEWKLELGENYRDVYDTYLHRLGNLTLTGYNAEYSNKSFNDKKICDNGFKNSNIHLNIPISQKDHWRRTEIEERNERLAKESLKLWFKPSTYIEGSVEPESLTLYSEPDEFTGKKFSKLLFTLPGKDDPIECIPLTKNGKPASDMKNYYLEVLKFLNEQEEYDLNRIINDDNESLPFISKNIERFRSGVELVSGIFVETNLSNPAKANFLRKIIDYFDISPDSVEFVIKK